MDEKPQTPDPVAEAMAACEVVGGRRRVTPAEHLAGLARAADELGLDAWDSWDTYGAKGAVQRAEEEVAGLLGTEGAVLLPSGTMGQQAALRTWCDRAGSQRVAMPDLSHLLTHEDDALRVLHGVRVEHLTVGRRTPTAADLRALPDPASLGAVLVELPLRDAGCTLPSWEDLEGLSAAARDLGVALHADGARLWESQPFYDRPLPEVVGLVDSVYVSFYKALGATSGAAVAASENVAEELRVWRHRLGGTLYRLTPVALEALVGLRDRLPLVPQCVAWARAVGEELEARGLRVAPRPVQTAAFQVFAPAEDVEVARAGWARVAARERVALCWPWGAADVPGWVVSEVTAGEALLEVEPARAAGWLAESVGL
ncbi:threonine aldolase family protein [Nocardioides bruguierae]|uniref:threonine aldolase family protein n=1 Tax=Nocardioides bruguierae TaxID=2945102 RepID=UPI002021B76B|nr:beta-eliminating lyase-related protein [Nocardioides bruguierae]MCL8026402.1 beta-eliminating lyase-related protein [Nocardioides bruguierae]